ncbi:MAG TPA: RagB/SusD family nutrient uptake outer membrane protein [Puia sp.]|nr:RagB/SusD family nutrient uptake outer membrane protein [Puia sp.]
MCRAIYTYSFLFLFLFWCSCNKITFLNTKPNTSLHVPSTPQDCQALLDDDWVMNGYGNSGYPYLPELSGDDLYLEDADYNKSALVDQETYIWRQQIDMGDALSDWDLPYKAVATSNTVLAILGKIPSSYQTATWNGLKGSALFYRAYAFFELARVFAPVYDSTTAGTDSGIPLPQSADINQKASRATVQQTYDQILGDLRQAEGLLPKDSVWLPTRPSPAAVYALFSRVFLSVGNYVLAGRYADSCLQLKHELMLYDTVSKTKIFPFYRTNPEMIFCAAYFPGGPAAPFRSHTDSNLFRSYEQNDLRKQLFFKYGDYFVGSYDQDGYRFGGLAVDEVLLTRSECYARAGNTAAAMADLNHLLETRWAAGTFIPYTAVDAGDALRQILMERRKQLLFRGTRWADLRRLNKDSRTAVTLSRTINGAVYTLSPKDPRWTLPLPGYILKFNPDMPQNIR